MPSFPKFTAWAKKVAAKPRPKPGAGGKKGGSKKGGKAGSKDGGEAALIAQIRARQAGALQPFGGVLGKLMARYGGAGEVVWTGRIGSAAAFAVEAGTVTTPQCPWAEQPEAADLTLAGLL